MFDREEIAKNIVAQRKMHGLTQKELAEALNISYQAISQWESAKSLPTIEMMYNLAHIFEVTVDQLISREDVANRDIVYRDSGLDVSKLYKTKHKIQKLISKDESIVSAEFLEPVFMKMDTSGMNNPVQVIAMAVPGSKAKMAREYGKDKEICEDLVARAINTMCARNVQSRLFKAQFVGGNMDGDLLYEMAKTFQETCEKSGVAYGGLSISAQPINFREGEYELCASIIGVCDQEQINFGNSLKAGDMLIALKTDGMDGVSYPFVRIMLNRKPTLRYEKIGDNTFAEAVLKPSAIYNQVIAELSYSGLIHGAYRIANSVINNGSYLLVPDNLMLRIDMDTIQIPELFRFIEKQNMIGSNKMALRFSLGVGMIVAVPGDLVSNALEIIQKYHDCYVIGEVETNRGKTEDKVRTEGRIIW